jgi:hypothetical protein
MNQCGFHTRVEHTGAVLGISLYSYLYLKLGNCYVFLIVSLSYVFSSTKLKNKRTKQVLPRSREWDGEERWSKQCIHIRVNVKMIKSNK